MAESSRKYRTPGRECSHADSGCCPACYDPCGLLKSTREFRERRSKERHFQKSDNAVQTQEENQKHG